MCGIFIIKNCIEMIFLQNLVKTEEEEVRVELEDCFQVQIRKDCQTGKSKNSLRAKNDATLHDKTGTRTKTGNC